MTEVAEMTEEATTQEEKKQAPKKDPHPLVGSTDDNVYPFPAPELVTDEQGNVTAWASGAPEDFDYKTQLPLKKGDFEKTWQYYQHKIELAQARLASLIKLRDEARKFGSAKERAALKRLETMSKSIADIQAKLAESGVDVSSILKQGGVNLD